MTDATEIELPAATRREAGINWPVFMDNAAWNDVAAWGAAQERANPDAYQQESGRVWDVLWMLSCYLRSRRSEIVYGTADITPVGSYGLYRVPGDRRDPEPRYVTLNVGLRTGGGGPEVVLTLGSSARDGQRPF